MTVEDPVGVEKAQISIRTTADIWQDLETQLISGTDRNGVWQSRWEFPANGSSPPPSGEDSHFYLKFNHGDTCGRVHSSGTTQSWKVRLTLRPHPPVPHQPKWEIRLTSLRVEQPAVKGIQCSIDSIEVVVITPISTSLLAKTSREQRKTSRSNASDILLKGESLLSTAPALASSF